MFSFSSSLYLLFIWLKLLLTVIFSSFNLFILFCKESFSCFDLSNSSAIWALFSFIISNSLLKFDFSLFNWLFSSIIFINSLLLLSLLFVVVLIPLFIVSFLSILYFSSNCFIFSSFCFISKFAKFNLLSNLELFIFSFSTSSTFWFRIDLKSSFCFDKSVIFFLFTLYSVSLSFKLFINFAFSSSYKNILSSNFLFWLLIILFSFSSCSILFWRLVISLVKELILFSFCFNSLSICFFSLFWNFKSFIWISLSFIFFTNSFICKIFSSLSSFSFLNSFILLFILLFISSFFFFKSSFSDL